MENKYWVPALEKANIILHAIAEKPYSLRLIDLSKQLNINKSSMYSLLNTLEQLNWIRRDKADTFSLGPSLGSLAGGYYKSNDLISSFHYEAALTKVIFNETIQLAELVGNEVFYLAKEEVPSPVRLASEPGMRFPAHSTALGKVLLSDLAIDQLIELLPDEHFVQATPHTIQTRQALIAELLTVVELGYATDLEEAVLGFCCAAIAIVKQGKVVAAVSCSMPKHHWELKKDQVIIEMKKLAGRLSLS
ncbi:IclR family transcriptional regulator [Paenibacillus psychroresistens]|uniref:IclR family transcriptional regulator n=1 Tax=Paenibacillus psychroresistens TaxID=1778678 RepID=A0A6B8RGJ7_9BACL|nr:IclR family transcriptional regulator [Paenibacillus psychroresistens]QGQ94548.1 IclR family transcriptional regulator [Paenibacillus psychroresistens]